MVSGEERGPEGISGGGGGGRGRGRLHGRDGHDGRLGKDGEVGRGRYGAVGIGAGMFWKERIDLGWQGWV